MLGWEDQPILNGGVGKACFHLAEALAKQVELTMIVPQADHLALEHHAEVVGLNELDLEEIKQAPVAQTFERFATTHYVPANLFPYEGSSIPADSTPVEEKTESVTVEVPAQETVKTTVSIPNGKPQINVTNGAKGTLNFEVIQFARYAARLASHKELDVVYAHDWMTFLAGMEIKTQRKVPLVIHVHSLSFDRQVGEPLGWIYELETRAMHEADLILAVSERTARMITKRYGVPAKKVQVVYNGADRVAPSPVTPIKRKQVTFLGRLVAQKGPLQFLKVAKQVLKKDPDVNFVVAGHGPQFEEAQQMVRRLGIEEAVTFTGFLQPSKAETLLKNSSVFCLPALSEPFGLAALEATLAGLPVVITFQTGAAEVLPEASVADCNDTEGLAKHILQLLEDEDLRKQQVEANQKALRQLTWGSTADHVMEALHSVLQLHEQEL
ncbi:glycosyltransferase family 4 protein [Sabulibacter ruber]|uniref:glycosyltransferase family 4 protein n=1 Tax=Sabulibacter ruber TaxID=2811901 RepID=UPI001A96D994|nr:glycosyltransferase family 4 protein [Sabulibacter ruber]